MPGAARESHIDDDPFAKGTHKFPGGSSFLNDPGADFKSCGVGADMLVKNTTDGSSGTISASSDVTENTVTVTLTGGTGNVWDNEDEYEIYLTGTEDSEISHIYTDRRFGQKVTKDILTKGFLPGDMDLDEEDQDVFGPGQPENPRRRY